MLRPLCAGWAFRLGTDAHGEHADQINQLSMRISFPILQMLILYTLSMRVRNWCVHWACVSGTDAYAEHTIQELMRTLSIRIRNWCVRWAYESGTYEHTSWLFLDGGEEGGRICLGPDGDFHQLHHGAALLPQAHRSRLLHHVNLIIKQDFFEIYE